MIPLIRENTIANMRAARTWKLKLYPIKWTYFTTIETHTCYPTNKVQCDIQFVSEDSCDYYEIRIYSKDIDIITHANSLNAAKSKARRLMVQNNFIPKYK